MRAMRQPPQRSKHAHYARYLLFSYYAPAALMSRRLR